MSPGPATGAAGADGSPVTVEAYQSAILSAITPLAPALLELAAAEGCVLAEDVTAAVALPSFRHSCWRQYSYGGSLPQKTRATAQATFSLDLELAEDVEDPEEGEVLAAGDDDAAESPPFAGESAFAGVSEAGVEPLTGDELPDEPLPRLSVR